MNFVNIMKRVPFFQFNFHMGQFSIDAQYGDYYISSETGEELEGKFLTAGDAAAFAKSKEWQVIGE